MEEGFVAGGQGGGEGGTPEVKNYKFVSVCVSVLCVCVRFVHVCVTMLCVCPEAMFRGRICPEKTSPIRLQPADENTRKEEEGNEMKDVLLHFSLSLPRTLGRLPFTSQRRRRRLVVQSLAFT